MANSWRRADGKAWKMGRVRSSHRKRRPMVGCGCGTMCAGGEAAFPTSGPRRAEEKSPCPRSLSWLEGQGLQRTADSPTAPTNNAQEAVPQPMPDRLPTPPPHSPPHTPSSPDYRHRPRGKSPRTPFPMRSRTVGARQDQRSHSSLHRTTSQDSALASVVYFHFRRRRGTTASVRAIISYPTACGPKAHGSSSTAV